MAKRFLREKLRRDIGLRFFCRCYYPQMSQESVSPVCGIFFVYNSYYITNLCHQAHFPQEWPEDLEELLRTTSLPTADLSADLSTQVPPSFTTTIEHCFCYHRHLYKKGSCFFALGPYTTTTIGRYCFPLHLYHKNTTCSHIYHNRNNNNQRCTVVVAIFTTTTS